jgi:hypothetical protein
MLTNNAISSRDNVMFKTLSELVKEPSLYP